MRFLFLFSFLFISFYGYSQFGDCSNHIEDNYDEVSGNRSVGTKELFLLSSYENFAEVWQDVDGLALMFYLQRVSYLTKDVSKWFSKKNFDLTIILGGKHRCIDKGSGVIFLYRDGTRDTFFNLLSFNCDRSVKINLSYSLKLKSIKTIRVFSEEGYVDHILSEEESDFFKFIVGCLEYRANTIK